MNVNLRSVEVVKRHDELGYGFTVTGERAALLSAIQAGSAAYRAGLKVGDLLLSINGEDVSSASHERIVALVGRTRNSIRLTVMSNDSASLQGPGQSLTDIHPDPMLSRGELDALRTRSGSLSHSYGSSSDSRFLSSARSGVTHLSKEAGSDLQKRGIRRSLFESSSMSQLSSPGGSLPTSHPLDANSMSPDFMERASDTDDRTSHSSASSLESSRRYGHHAIPKASSRTSVHSLPTGTGNTSGSYQSYDQLAGTERHSFPVLVAYFGGIEMSGRLADKDERLRMTRECVSQARREHRRPQTITMVISARGIKLVDQQQKELLDVPKSSIALTWVDTNDHRVFSLVQRHSSSSSEPSPMHTTTGHVFKVLPGGYNAFDDPSSSQTPLHSTKSSSSGAWPIIRLLKYLYGGRSDRKPSHSTRPPSTGSSESGGSRMSPPPIASAPQVNVTPSPQLSGNRRVDRLVSLPVRADTRYDDPFDRKSGSLDVRLPSAAFPHASDVDSERSSREWDGELDSLKRTGSDPDVSTLHRRRKGAFDAISTPDEGNHNLLSPQTGGNMQNKRSGSLESLVNVTVASPKKPEVQPSQPAVGRVAGWAANIHLLLEDPEGVDLFREFLQLSYCEENILFYFAASNFKENFDETSKAKLQNRVDEIYGEYIQDDARNVINIDCKVRRQIDSDRNGTPTKTMFDAAMAEVFKLMKTDSHPKFTRSDLFRTYMLAEIEGKPLPCNEKSSDDQKKHDKDKEKSWVFGKLFSFNIGKGRPASEARSVSRGRTPRSATFKLHTKGDGFPEASDAALPTGASSEVTLTSSSEADLNSFRPLSRTSMSTSAMTLTSKVKKEANKQNKWSGSLPWRRHGPAADYKQKEFPRPPVRQVSSSPEVMASSIESAALKSSGSVENSRVTLRVTLPDSSTTVLRSKPSSVLLDTLRPLLQGKGLLIDNVDVYEVLSDKSQEKVTPTQKVKDLQSTDIVIQFTPVINLAFSDGSMDFCRPQYGCSIQDVLTEVLTERGLGFNSVAIELDGNSGQEKLDLLSTSHSVADRTLLITERQSRATAAAASARSQSLPNGGVSVSAVEDVQKASEKAKRQTSFRATFRKRFSRRKSIATETAPDINQTLPRNFRSQPASPTAKDQDKEKNYFTLSSSHSSASTLSSPRPSTPTKRANASFEEELMDPNSPAHGLLSMLDKMQSDRLDDQRQPVSTNSFTHNSLGSSGSASAPWLSEPRGLPSMQSSSLTSSASTLPRSIDHDESAATDTTDSPSTLPRPSRKLPRFSTSSLERRPRSKSVSVDPIRRSSSVSILTAVRSLSLERRRKRACSNSDISDGHGSSGHNSRPSSPRKATAKRKADPVEDFMSSFRPRLTSQTSMPMWSK